MASEKLTARKVTTAKTPGLYGDGKGLYLRVGAGAARSWVYRFMISGKAREMGLGSLDDVGLADARERAREARQLRREGVDPIEAARAKKAARQVEAATAMTFAQCAERYIQAHRDGWKNLKHAKQWQATLHAFVYPAIGVAARRGGRRCAGDDGARANLDDKAPNRIPRPRSHRGGARLGDGA
jgi:hypothetical protein